MKPHTEPYTFGTKRVSRQIDLLHNGRHVTNFENRQLDLYREAIATFNCVYPTRAEELHIDNNAFIPTSLLPLENCSALVFTGENFNLTDFWDIFDRLKAR